MKDYLRNTLLLMGISAPGTVAKDLAVAAASDLAAALTEIKGNYESQSRHKLLLTFGATGSLFSQIRQGAPFDIFFSADMDYPRQLAALRIVDEAAILPYATGKLVLWVPRAAKLDIEKLGAQALLDPSVQKIALANPAVAPYGRAAEQALRHLGLWEKLQPKLLIAESVSQAAQLVESGSAQAGLLALSLALSPALKAKGRSVELPAASYTPLVQTVCLLNTAPSKAEAAEFFAYLNTAPPRAILKRYGFTPPSK